MRTIRMFGLATLIVCAWAGIAAAQDWQIVPGKSVGPININTTEKQLIEVYGKNNVKRQDIDVGEGETRSGAVIFPNDPQRRASIVWRDAVGRTGPESVTIRDKGTLWKTDRGITIGTTLKTIEQLNGKAFVLTGFGWDYSGTVLHANGGRIGELGKASGEEITDRTLLLRLEPTAAMQKTPEFTKMLGDGTFLSSDPSMQKLDPRVYEMIIEFSATADAAYSANSQSDEQMEAELVAGIKDLQAYSTYGGNYDDEKLTKAQEAFEAKLLKYTKDPSSMKFAFRELGEHLSIASSDDGMLRVFSWDLEDGGTMHRFARVYQFQAANGEVYSRIDPVVEEGMGRGYVHHVYSLDTSSGRLYILCSLVIASSKVQQQSADIYKIVGATLRDDLKLIRTKAGLTNALRFEYDNFSVIDRNRRPEDLISFDEGTRTLKIPVVINDEDHPDGDVTDKTISYRFTGKYFVRVS
ncbi:MAG: hypothetical protein QUS14_00405 [Pyrinomonadaceae bacterium]|nr:hypothetical protein [Pyrinomonadaceae bacterium]